MKCPTCQSVISIKSHLDHRRLGWSRVYHCNPCGTDFRTFRPCAGLEAGQEIITDYTALCDCGRVARHSKPVGVIGAGGSILQVAPMFLCDKCMKLEIEMTGEAV